MTDAQRLYNALDRLVHATISRDGHGPPRHRFGPVGAALHELHALRQHETAHCVCAATFEDPQT